MHLTKTKYPISNKLRELAHRADRRTDRLLKLLGYESLRKGFKWYDRRANEGELDAPLFRALCELYPEERDELISALEETTRIKEQERLLQRKKEFTPHLWAETEKEPYNFFSAMHAASLKNLAVPRGRLPDMEIERRITEHFRQSGGSCERFGRIRRYRYEPEYGVRFYFDCDGRRLPAETS